MHRIEQILTSYHITPYRINKITDNLYRIDDGHRYYALKKSALTKNDIHNWESVFHQAHTFQLHDILPVFLTTTRNLYNEVQDDIYYLSPWINQQDYTVAQFFNVIGHIHKKTKRSYPIQSKEQRHQDFKQYKKMCEEEEKKWYEYIDHFEQNRYMSPFELQVCTHYRDLTLVYKFLYERIEAFMESMDEETKWSYSLCHGNLKRSHFLFDGQGYLINWENATFDNAISDLARFFRNETVAYDAQTDKMIDQFSSYLDENTLELSELHLLNVYLLDPSYYMNLIKLYVKQPKHAPMIQQVRNLEQAFRQLQFGVHFYEYVKSEHDLFFLDDDLESDS